MGVPSARLPVITASVSVGALTTISPPDSSPQSSSQGDKTAAKTKVDTLTEIAIFFIIK